MADLSDLINRFNGLVHEMISTREQESIIIAKDTMALIRNRIQNDKVDSNGQEFGQYSDAVVPQWMLYGRSLSDGAEEKIKKGDWFQSYSDLREANNLQTDAIDFTFSGDTMRNTGVTEVSNTNFSTSVTLGGQTTRASSILGYQEPRHGNIITPSEAEIKLVREAHEERVNKLIQKFLQ